MEPKVEPLAPVVHEGSGTAHDVACFPRDFVYFAGESEACQLVWESLQSVAQEGSLIFAEGDVFWRLSPSQAEAKLREPTSELVLEPSL